MSFEEKRFCFSCKLDAEQLKKKNKGLQTCSYCKIAQYCGKQCQRRDLKDSHKNLCVRGFKKYDDLTKQAKDILKDQGHDLDRICLKKCSSLQAHGLFTPVSCLCHPGGWNFFLALDRSHHFSLKVKI